ncbi:hypothetical protein, partial [Cellulomonas endophytica]|uniref:hypothetical protein n=1 Tax=Cellulomonas endophytica TaxID=2494735 RepID=UPI0013E956F5
MRRGAARLAGLVTNSLVAAFAPLVVVPVVTTTHGAAGWGALAVASSVGAFGAVAVESGWSLDGPQRVARGTEPHARRLLAVSLAGRALLVVPVAAAAALVVLALAPSYAAEAAGVAAVSAAFGLNSNWYLVGTGRPWSMLLLDTAPRVAAGAGAAGLLAAGAPLAVYPAALGVALLLSLGAVHRRLRPAWGFVRLLGPRRLLRSVSGQTVVTAGRLASATYIALPVTLLAVVSPAAVPAFAAVERVQRLTLAGLQMLPAALQTWVGSRSTSQDREERARKGALVVLLGGVLAAAAHTLLAPVAIDVLFSGTVAVTPLLLALSAGVIVLTSATRGIGGLWLVSRGRARRVAASGGVGMAVGVPLALGLGALFGAAGGLAAEAAAETSVL